MKRLIFQLAIMLSIATLMNSCKKSDDTSTGLSTSGTSSTAAITAMTTQAHTAFMQTQVSGGDLINPFLLENDGLPGVYMAEGAALDSTAADSVRNPMMKLRGCLQHLTLSMGQKDSLHRAMRGFANCKDQTMHRYQGMVRTLVAKFEKQRMDLMMQLHRGTISKADFTAAVSGLKQNLQAAIQNQKEAEAGAFKACYERFLQALQTILTPDQFTQLSECFTS